MGGLIDSSNTMLFLSMINGGNTMLLLAGVGGLIDGRDMMLLLLAGQWFGYLHATANQRAWAD
jgi:hypothetical protein